jgi:diguanylate cyclase (GGDEF)-like protein/PAS domain S-box-containing protein
VKHVAPGNVSLAPADAPASAVAEDQRKVSGFHFDLAASVSPAGLWDWDLAGDRQRYSTRFRELLGYADEPEFNREFRFREHLHPEDRDRVLEAVREHLESRAVLEETFRLRCKDGAYRWFAASGQAQWDGSGKAVRCGGAITDVTQVKIREEALRRAEASLREALAEEQAILDTAMFGIAIMKDRTIQRCNRRYAEIFGYAEGELAGCSSRRLFASDEDFASLGVRSSRAMAELGSYSEEREFLRKDGTGVWCHFAGKPLDASNPDQGTLWVAEDITEHKRAEAQLRRSEERLALAVRASDSGIWDWEQDGNEMFYSARFRELLGHPTLSNARFHSVFNFRDNLHPDDRERTMDAVQRALQTLEPFNEVCRLRCADGGYRWFHSRGQALGSHGGQARRMAGSITDVTEARIRDEMLTRTRSELDAAHDRLSDAIECIPDAFALFDAGDRLVLCNRNYAEVFAGSSDVKALAGCTFEDLTRRLVEKGEPIPPDYAGDTEGWIAERLRMHRNPVEGGATYQLGDGRWYQVREQRTRDGGIVGVHTDVTELKMSEERIRHLAHHDPLTGLPNRRLLQDRMERSLALARRNREQFAVMVVDLDRFKVINDTYGHGTGDDVLRAVAARMRSSIREADTVARHGGDEFIVLLPELREAKDALTVAEKVIAGVSAPIDLEGRLYQVGASVGLAVYPEDAADVEGLLRRADDAMYVAKQSGGNRALRPAT